MLKTDNEIGIILETLSLTFMRFKLI